MSPIGSMPRQAASRRGIFQGMLACSALAILFAGCGVSLLVRTYKTNVEFGNGEEGPPHEAWDEGTYKGAVFGLVEVTDPIPFDKLCPGGVGYIEQRSRPVDTFLQALTFGFYNPQTVSVFCTEAGGRHGGEEEESGNRDEGGAKAPRPSNPDDGWEQQ